MIFEKLVVHRALRVRVHHFGRVALVRGKNFAWGVSAFFLAPGFPRFPSASCMTASSVTSVFEESCFGFDRLRRAVALVFGDRSLLE